MTSKYTEAEVISVLEDLIGRPEVVDRRGEQTAVDIVGSLIEFVYRSMNSDIDSIYSLINLHVARQVKLCTEVISYLSELYELAPLAASNDATLNNAELIRISNELITASFEAGAQQEELLAGVNNIINNYLTGDTGRTPQYARNRGMELLLKAAGTADIIQREATSFPDIVSDYMGAPFEDVMKQRQVERSAAVSSGLGENVDDPNEAKLKLAVITTMLGSRAEPKRDVRDPKYSGPVTLLPGTKAELTGATLPLIIQHVDYKVPGDTDGDVTIEHDESGTVDTGTVEAEVSPVPVIKASISSGEFFRSDSGLLHVGDVSLVGAGPLMMASHDYEMDSGELISEATHTSTILFTDTVMGIECPFLKTYVIPNTVTITLTTIHAESYSSAGADMFGLSSYMGIQSILSPITLKDDGDGGLVDSDGVNWGLIDYHRGAVWIKSGVDIDLSSDVTVNYKYNPYYDGRSYEVTGWVPEDDGSFKDWNSFGVWENNSYIQASLSSVEGALDITSAYNDGGGASNFEGGVLSISSRRGGSASRLSFPVRDVIEVNPDSLAPVWRTTPTDYNQALGLTANVYKETYGRDTLKDQVSNHLDKLDVGVSKLSVLSTTTFTTVDGQPNKLSTSANLDSVEVGDNIEFTSERNFHTKIINLSDSIIEVHPEVPLPIDGSELADSTSLEGKITRDRLKLTSTSDDPRVSLSVSSEGLGFSGEAMASTTAFAIGSTLNITDVVTLPGYAIKPGDAVVQTEGDVSKPIGTVRSVDVNTITITPTEDGYTYPYTDVEIYSLGWSRFRTIAPKISVAGSTTARLINEGELLVKGSSYLKSGSGQNAFYQAVLTLRDNIGELRNLYLDYDANIVNTANSLLTYFKDDKISLISGLLSNCRFREIAEMTPTTMSNQSSVDVLLEQVVDLLGGNATSWDSYEGENLLNDYLVEESDHTLSVSRDSTSEDAD